MSNLILLALFNIALSFAVCKIVFYLSYKEILSELEAEMDALYDKGLDDGYAEGYKCGLTKGREIGQEEALRSTEMQFANDKNNNHKI
jgi:hypothetical protein